jgi:N-acetyl-anhydromuramyl-L-alanine amidase AmpD
MYDPPAPPYLGPPARSSGSANKPVRRIVVHCTVSATATGGARAIAAYFRSANAGGSAHYVVDPEEVVQAAYDSVVCWHAPPNPNSIGVELCDPMDGRATRWADRDHQAMLHLAAKLTAELCLAYDVPARKLSVAEVKAGHKGICGHADVSDAFGQSTHWDPGPAFPWADYMRLVRRHVRRLSDTEVTPPAPTPAEHEQPSRVQMARRLLRRALRNTGAGAHHRRDSIRAALRELPRR